MANKFPKYVIIKTLNAKNKERKERILKTARERDQCPYRLTLDV